jgi:hypothetical protein
MRLEKNFFEELRCLCLSPNINEVIKSRRKIWPENGALVRREMHVGFGGEA